jgi:hypothetical protein
VRQVLFEHDSQAGILSGFTDNYIKIEIPENAAEVNTLGNVMLNRLSEDGERVVATPG